tara:strand:+ start:97 stop:327 length:231 start_codon:yes stop_codon:yes gene_type:complete
MNDSVVVVNSKKDLIEQGYISANLNKEIIYGDYTFLLMKPGIKSNKKSMYSGTIMPTNPTWKLKLNDMVIEISNII